MAQTAVAGIPQEDRVMLSRATHLLTVERPEAAGSFLRAILDRCG